MLRTRKFVGYEPILPNSGNVFSLFKDVNISIKDSCTKPEIPPDCNRSVSVSQVLHSDQAHTKRLRFLVDRARSEAAIMMEVKQKANECNRVRLANSIATSIRTLGVKAKANVGGAAYNIITRAYDATIAGDRLRYHDDLTAERCQRRAIRLSLQNHSGFSPITGTMM